MISLEIFKQCPMCLKIWRDREQFLLDKSLHFNGYLGDYEKVEFGLYYFTHDIEGCGSTMVLDADEFFDLYPETRYKKAKK